MPRFLREGDGAEGLNSKNFETAVRVLKSAWFSEDKLGTKLWSGSEKNLYDVVTKRFDGSGGTYADMNYPAAVLTSIRRASSELLCSSEIAKDLKIEGSDRALVSRFLSATFQLLCETGDIVRHPDHLGATDSDNMVSVWSDARGPWIKPEVLNPELAVLAHAAKGAGGWLYELFARDQGIGGAFSHHAIKQAAQRLDQRGFVVLSDQFPPHGAITPSGHRPYACVRLTEECASLVEPWARVPVSGVLDRSKYEELRRLLVTREPLQSCSGPQ